MNAGGLFAARTQFGFGGTHFTELVGPPVSVSVTSKPRCCSPSLPRYQPNRYLFSRSRIQAFIFSLEDLGCEMSKTGSARKRAWWHWPIRSARLNIRLGRRR